jgi:hypothetical protein
MSLYYFHVRTDHGLVEDEEGIDLPHLQAVMNEALTSAAEFSAEAEWSGSLAFEVMDEHGQIVLRMPVRHLAVAWQQLAQLTRTHMSGPRH